jgi:hypothetical protein
MFSNALFFGVVAHILDARTIGKVTSIKMVTTRGRIRYRLFILADASQQLIATLVILILVQLFAVLCIHEIDLVTAVGLLNAE